MLKITFIRYAQNNLFSTVIFNIAFQPRVCYFALLKEKLEYTKGAIKRRKSKEDRQCNGQKKKDKQRIRIVGVVISVFASSEVDQIVDSNQRL